MSRVDPLSQTLVINDSRKIQFSKEDVARVFRIPSHGLSVAENGMPGKETVSKITAEYLGVEAKDQPSIKAAQAVIERDYGGSMSPSEENAFKAAFVVYVMSLLLSPGAKYDHASVDYWNTLRDPLVIHTFDWSEDVIQRLLYAVLKLKSDLKSNLKVPSITGCTLFLQGLYLDSIWNMDHNKLPRIQPFNDGTMKSMILGNTLSGPDDYSESDFGNSKLRAPSGLCYHWAAVQDSNGTGHPMSQQMALCEATTSILGTCSESPCDILRIRAF